MNGDIGGRINWTRSLTVVMIVAVAAVILGTLVSVGAKKTDRLYFKNTAGAVLFDHGMHRETAECSQCHHDLYSAAQAQSCQECHDEDITDAELSHQELKEIHSRDCSTCHDQSGNEEQVLSCRECHPGVQPSETKSVSCTECHDDDFTPEMISHDEYLEMEDHSCLGCHTPGTISSVYHVNCSNCHLETSRERFTKADGELLCGACHLR